MTANTQIYLFFVLYTFIKKLNFNCEIAQKKRKKIKLFELRNCEKLSSILMHGYTTQDTQIKCQIGNIPQFLGWLSLCLVCVFY